jgi:hypothetical protein
MSEKMSERLAELLVAFSSGGDPRHDANLIAHVGKLALDNGKTFLAALRAYEARESAPNTSCTPGEKSLPAASTSSPGMEGKTDPAPAPAQPQLQGGDGASFAWLIEAPGQNYLGAREISHYREFYWTADHNKALRFFSQEQADAAMMAMRQINPKLWAFAVNLGEAKPVEHGWFAKPSPSITEAVAAETETQNFTNELGNQVSVDVTRDPLSSQVTISIAGPLSESTNTVTDKEALTIYRCLGACLGVDAVKADRDEAVAAETESHLGEAIDAICDAAADGEGQILESYLKTHLAKHKLAIVSVEERADAARWRALVTSFGPEIDLSSPDKQHALVIRINVDGCEVWINNDLDFKATLERALDDEINRIAAAIRLRKE